MSYSRRNFVTPEQQYFSIDDILATNERVPCRFDVPVQKLGFLDPSSESVDIRQGVKLDLPLWMAKGIHTRRIITVETPKVYREAYREILSADANVVDLHKMGPYFYHFGKHLLQFPHPDLEDIAKMLDQTFRNRFRKLMDSAQNSLDEDVTSLTSRLDRTEQALFNIGQKGLYDMKRWQEHNMQKIETSDLVVSHRKRKRAVLEDSI